MSEERAELLARQVQGYSLVVEEQRQKIERLEAVYRAAEHFDIAYSTDTDWIVELDQMREAIASYQSYLEARAHV